MALISLASPERTQVNGYGIIEIKDWSELLDAVAILRLSNAWDEEKDHKPLMAWFRQLLSWMMTSNKVNGGCVLFATGVEGGWRAAGKSSLRVEISLVHTPRRHTTLAPSSSSRRDPRAAAIFSRFPLLAEHKVVVQRQ